MLQRKSLLGRKKKKVSKDNTARENVYFDEDMEPVEVKMVPDDQLTLDDAELDEEFTKTLTSLDPNNPSKRTHFNFKAGAFESKPNTQHIAFHIKQDGVIWHKKEKEELEKLKRAKQREHEASTGNKEDGDNKENEQNADEQVDKDNDNKGMDKESATKRDSEDSKEEKQEILVKNQFNFSDRASQTFNEPLRDREVQTEPAPKSIFSQNANPSAIRDEYLCNLLKAKQQRLEEENKKKKNSAFASSKREDEDTDDHKIKHHDEGDALLHSKEMLSALKIMERVTVLNANSSSYENFRFYADSDYKKGSFLQRLWTFNYQQRDENNNQKKMVTCLEWNKSHLDMFGVGYGSFDFNYQTNGMICIYSLKSTAFPEKIIECESGVMSMSFHPKYASLLCVGHYDGSVAVYDVRNRDDSPIYSSENPETHHSDPVWDIKWYFEELQHELVFYSISSDSEIKIWRMSQNELNHEIMIKLSTPQMIMSNIMNKQGAEDRDKEDIGGDNVVAEVDDDSCSMLALCSCFDFNPFMEHLYLVGTEDGHILECSKTYNDGATKIYANAHFMNIYCVKWNPFHSKIFLSCSEDWTIKVWEVSTNASNEPIISYDLGCSVNDIAWSPYSSTIFAAVTSDGKVHIFDLVQNKNAPLCSQQITKKSKNIKLSTVSFPIGFPLIIVGDEKGNIFALKLSPNLFLDKVKHRDILKTISQNMFDNEAFKEKEKEKLIDVLNVTGNKVFDLIEHFSPKPKKRTL